MDDADSKASDHGPIKPRILALVAQGQARQQAFIAQLSDAERAAIGAPDAWAAKDNIAHITGWIDDASRVISTALRGEIPEPSPDETEFNPRTFAEHQHQLWDEVLADAAQAHERLLATLEACSEADLADPDRFPWRRSSYPLWTYAHVCGNEHPAEHYGQYYLDRGDVERARAVREEAVETSRRYIGETDAQGYMLYNLGCFYAKISRPDLALAALHEAMDIVPRLREWSQEDPELASLRDDPAFQSLAASTA